MFGFTKKEIRDYSQKDCDNLKVLTHIMSKMDERGFDRSMKDLGIFLPHRLQEYEQLIKELTEKEYKKGTPSDIIVKQLIPDFQHMYKSGYLTSEVMNLGSKCREYKASQAGSKKKKVTPKKKKVTPKKKKV
jgi:hypothetical protein